MKHKQKPILLLCILTLCGLLGSSLTAAGSKQAPSAPLKEESTTTTEPDGTKIIKRSDGTSLQIKPDNTKIIQESDGSVIQIEPNGTKIIKRSDGTIFQINPDGTKSIKKADGTKMEFNTDED